MINENWVKAKQILDNISEPNISFGDNPKHLDTSRPDIMEFSCRYVKHITKNGIKSWLVLFNEKDNCCYLNEFN